MDKITPFNGGAAMPDGINYYPPAQGPDGPETNGWKEAPGLAILSGAGRKGGTKPARFPPRRRLPARKHYYVAKPALPGTNRTIMRQRFINCSSAFGRDIQVKTSINS